MFVYELRFLRSVSCEGDIPKQISDALAKGNLEYRFFTLINATSMPTMPLLELRFLYCREKLSPGVSSTKEGMCRGRIVERLVAGHEALYRVEQKMSEKTVKAPPWKLQVNDEVEQLHNAVRPLLILVYLAVLQRS